MVTEIIIPKGYRKTDVGVIPNDWKVKFLAELFTFSGGFTASREELSDEGLCYLHYGDIHNSTKTYIDVSNEYADIPKLDVPINRVPKKALLNDGDVVFVDASEDDEGASRHIVVRNPKNIIYISGLHTIVSKSKNESLDNTYKQFCFQTRDVKRQFKFYAVGTKVTGISKTNIERIQIPIPPKPEQTAVANSLNDVDTLISKLEELIVKKQNIKHGAMQELLTGQKRLPGFSGKWEVKKLGDLGNCFAGGTPSTSKAEYWNGDIIWLPSGRIQNNYIKQLDNEKTITKLGLEKSAARMIKKNSVLIAITGATCANIGLLEFEATANQSVVAVEPYTDNYRLIYYLLLRKRGDILSLQSGSAQGGTNLTSIKKIEVKVPKDPEEQTAIAQILSDMDLEIEQLEQKLDKYKMIKQGMLQELLTGRTRLI